MNPMHRTSHIRHTYVTSYNMTSYRLPLTIGIQACTLAMVTLDYWVPSLHARHVNISLDLQRHDGRNVEVHYCYLLDVPDSDGGLVM
ncbi:hypothetical protein BC936DRAFT_143923 [Jimgerdemannia flammicorona]|uniref:Uncharacterized protein n=1 Tax=Jimgerdemannia flammicorona TaxID=994334 RepID=A0A433DD91_9FUNG|nr:hypothetical protein BC936DRAFT_143923 [Jimgerdemannia flammicorona]